jgi:hypothetical protein
MDYPRVQEPQDVAFASILRHTVSIGFGRTRWFAPTKLCRDSHSVKDLVRNPTYGWINKKKETGHNNPPRADKIVPLQN